eukprot:gene656-1006_t
MRGTPVPYAAASPGCVGPWERQGGKGEGGPAGSPGPAGRSPAQFRPNESAFPSSPESSPPAVRQRSRGGGGPGCSSLASPRVPFIARQLSPTPRQAVAHAPPGSPLDVRRLPSVKRFHVHSYCANTVNEDRLVIDVTTPEFHLFAIFDGHGGPQCSMFAEKSVVGCIREERSKFPPGEDPNWEVILDRAFEEVDRRFVAIHADEMPTRGSTAILCVVTSDKVHTACIGDSRAVLCQRNGAAIDAVPLSQDQDCNNESEVAKLMKRTTDPRPVRRGTASSGPAVKRVAGSLMVTRALGDPYLKYPQYSFVPYKQHLPYITSNPVVSQHALSANDAAIVLASDGLYNMLSNQEVANGGMSSSSNPAEHLVRLALNRAASAQNMTLRMLENTRCGPERRRMHDDITVLVVELGVNKVHTPHPREGFIVSKVTRDAWEAARRAEEQSLLDREAARKAEEEGLLLERAASTVQLEGSEPEHARRDDIDDTVSLSSQRSHGSNGRAGGGFSNLIRSMARKRAARPSPPPLTPISGRGPDHAVSSLYTDSPSGVTSSDICKE